MDEYLHTSYEHDPEWVDGCLKERGVPDGYHSYFQTWFISYFEQRKVELGLRALPEVRLRVSARAFRLPDMILIPVGAPFLPLPVEAPILCIEVLSPDDRRGELEEKLRDYSEMGVGATWVVDPRRRIMTMSEDQGVREVEVFELPGTPARITKAELFAELDELEGKL